MTRHVSYTVSSINPLGRFSVEDTRKDIPQYAFLNKCVSFRKDENINQSKKQKSCLVFLSGELETHESFEKFLKQELLERDTPPLTYRFS